MDKTPLETPLRSPRGGKSKGKGKLRSGNPGNKGGGRHPDVFKRFLAQLRGDPKFHKAIRTAAHDSESRGFATATKLATEYDETKPAARTDITSKDQAIHGVVFLPATVDE